MAEINPLHLEIASLREQLEYKDALIADLQAQITFQRTTAQIEKIRSHWSLRQSDASVVAFMSDGKIKPKHRIWDAGAHRSEDVDSKGVDVLICRIRKRIGHDAIATHWGTGFSMAPEMCQQVRAVMEGAQQ